MGRVAACRGLAGGYGGDAHVSGFSWLGVDLHKCLHVSPCLCVHVAKLPACLIVSVARRVSMNIQRTIKMVCTDLEGIVLSEISQTEKDLLGVTSHVES